jgi:hypothetical protein
MMQALGCIARISQRRAPTRLTVSASVLSAAIPQGGDGDSTLVVKAAALPQTDSIHAARPSDPIKLISSLIEKGNELWLRLVNSVLLSHRASHI